jgi:UDP-glucuronate 4-epimerase
MRFFTVYGPWGRPDMAVYKFSRKINLNRPIDVYNYGNHSRDFSYIDDTTQSIYLILKNLNKLKQYQVA